MHGKGSGGDTSVCVREHGLLCEAIHPLTHTLICELFIVILEPAQCPCIPLPPHGGLQQMSPHLCECLFVRRLPGLQQLCEQEIRMQYGY